MPYIKETCKAGKTKEYCFYYSRRFHGKKEGKREKKENPTSEAQKRVNIRQAERKLTRKMNANFTPDDYYITLSYEKDERPQGKEELQKHVAAILRDLRRVYKQCGKELKYIWVAEIGERGAVHIHMVINSIDIQKIKRLWKYGHMHIDPLYEDGNYRKLAAYFIKYSEKTLNTTGELQGKRWNASKNLITPPERKRIIRSRDHYSCDIKVPEGWYLDKDSIREGIHEITGYSYFNYTLVKLE